MSGIDTCAEHAICWQVNEEGEGTCLAMCEGSKDAPVCPAGTSCSISNLDVLILCLETCDPIVSNCDIGDVCAYGGDGFFCVTDASGEEGYQYDPCTSANGCNEGLLCAASADIATCDQGVSGCCTGWCHLDEPGFCFEGLQCLAWYDPGEAPAGYENLGYCAD